jgi:hypothetical protein
VALSGAPSPPGEIDVFPAGAANAATPRKITSTLLYPTGGTLAWGSGGSLFASANPSSGYLLVEYSASQLASGAAPTPILQSYYLPPNNPNYLLIILSFAVDSRGDVFVVGTPNGYPPAYGVYEYAAGYTNATIPTKLSATPTGITAPTLVRIDSSDNLYVVNAPSSGATSILVFSATNPNTAPLRTIGGPDSGFSLVSSFAVGPDGTLTAFDSSTLEVYVFAPGATSFPNVFQSSALNWPQSPIAVDANDNVYGAEAFFGSPFSSSIVAFPAGATGVKAPLFSVQSPTLAPAGILFAE